MWYAVHNKLKVTQMTRFFNFKFHEIHHSYVEFAMFNIYGTWFFCFNKWKCIFHLFSYKKRIKFLLRRILRILPFILSILEIILKKIKRVHPICFVATHLQKVQPVLWLASIFNKIVQMRLILDEVEPRLIFFSKCIIKVDQQVFFK